MALCNVFQNKLSLDSKNAQFPTKADRNNQTECWKKRVYLKYFDVFFYCKPSHKKWSFAIFGMKKSRHQKTIEFYAQITANTYKNTKRHKNRSVSNLKSRNSTKWQQCLIWASLKHSQIIRSLKSNYFYMQIFGVCVFFSHSCNTCSTIIWFGIF